MNIDAYLHLLHTAPSQSVSYGSGGVAFFPPAEIGDAQDGYAVDPDGVALTGNGEGDWRPSWVVIARETRCGDPIFIDLDQPGMPVHTAMHGMGDWDPERIADSAALFFRALESVRFVAAGREHPVALAANPLPDTERSAVLREIAAMNPRSELAFWESLLEEDL